eukprot:TRINITY_DN197_c0_g1_i2.p1 TRINITY_DN197_c0_g1~~TRINITY_DN197_c0_g1_i2.p1  ORF type:complete len:499 (+),score=126.72 TRINITY_DN197_c0_g1_i2:119-1498(+)
MKTLFTLFLLFGVTFSLINVNITSPSSTTLSRCTEIANDGTSPWLYFVEQAGMIHAFPTTNWSIPPVMFFNITDRVSVGEDSGLFGLAFHPSYATNGYFFVYYSDTADSVVVSRFMAEFMPNSTFPSFRMANASTEIVLMRIPLNDINMGGKLAFYNGSLYISVGVDGMKVTDLGRSNNNYNGKILRINVDQISSNGNYSLPLDNPFYNNPNYLLEIWATGFRNPWKFSFDCANGWMYAADEGISSQEEVNLVRAGNNYGYPIYEGNLCVNSTFCNSTGLSFPIFTYNSTGSNAIIGGYVYRGTSLDSLFGWYIFGDFITGNLWALDVDTANNYTVQPLGTTLYPTISTFGRDIYGNIYFALYSNGTIYRIGNSGSLGSLDCRTRSARFATSSGTSSGSATGSFSSGSVSSGTGTQTSAALSTVTRTQTTRFTFTYEESAANRLDFVCVFSVLIAMIFF